MGRKLILCLKNLIRQLYGKKGNWHRCPGGLPFLSLSTSLATLASVPSRSSSVCCIRLPPKRSVSQPSHQKGQWDRRGEEGGRERRGHRVLASRGNLTRICCSSIISRAVCVGFSPPRHAHSTGPGRLQGQSRESSTRKGT